MPVVVPPFPFAIVGLGFYWCLKPVNGMPFCTNDPTPRAAFPNATITGPFATEEQCQKNCKGANPAVPNVTAQATFDSNMVGFFAAEMISGGRAVAFDQFGNLQVAMASVSGRMPAVGYVSNNIASGDPTRMYNRGVVFYPNDGSSPFSGSDNNKSVFVGRSGALCTAISETFASGDLGQKVGTVFASGLSVVLAFGGSPIFSGGTSGASQQGNFTGPGFV